MQELRIGAGRAGALTRRLSFPRRLAYGGRCRRQRSRSEWPEVHAAGVACDPLRSLSVVFDVEQRLPSPCGRAGHFRNKAPVPLRGLGHLRAKASTRLRRAGHFRNKASVPLRGPGHFLLLVQEKVTKEKHTLTLRFSGSCPKSPRQRPGSAEGTSMYPAESARSRADPDGPDRPLPPQREGAPERRASCAPEQNLRYTVALLSPFPFAFPFRLSLLVFRFSLFASARRSALLLGPHCIAAAAAAMPAGAARWIAPIPPLAHGCAIGGTQVEAAYFSGRSPKSAMPGVHFFWLLFFVQAKKSDPLAVGEWKLSSLQPKQRHWIPAFAGMTSQGVAGVG